jgi:hypothetical protein
MIVNIWGRPNAFSYWSKLSEVKVADNGSYWVNPSIFYGVDETWEGYAELIRDVYSDPPAGFLPKSVIRTRFIHAEQSIGFTSDFI